MEPRSGAVRDELIALSHAHARGEIDRREFLARLGRLGISATAAGALLAATRAAPGAAFTSPQHLRLRLPVDLSNVDPANSQTFSDWTIISAVYEGLVTFKPGTYERMNQLAAAFHPSSDGRRIDFTLKKGIQFHGGYGEVTAEDVKFSYERSAAVPPFKPTPNSQDWTGLKQVVVKDRYSGTIVFHQNFAPFLTSGVESFDGAVLSKKAVEHLGPKLASHPIGTGPYEFVSWTQGQSVKLRRFAGYGGASKALFPHGRPTWQEIDFQVIPDDNAADVALRSGAIDFGQISLNSVQRFMNDHAFRTRKVPTTNTWFLSMNVRNPKLKDIRVRQAIRAAIDVPAIIKTAFNGLWSRASGMFAPTLPIGYWAHAPIQTRDVNQAKALLRRAGVNGLRLQLDYSTDPNADLVVQIIQSNLADIGITATLNKVDGAAYYVASPATAKRELSYWWWAASPDPYYYSASFTCSQVNAWNWSHRCDPTFDRLLDRAAHAPSRVTRQHLYEQASKRWNDACSDVWIAWMNNYFAYKPGLKPVTTPSGNILPQYFAAT